LPLGFRYDDEHHEELRFLNTQEWDYQKAYDSILDYDRWLRQELIPVLSDYERFERHLQSGVLYGYGRDRSQRPIIVFDMRRWIDAGLSADELLGTIDFLTGYTIFNALVPGRVEQSTWIIDMQGVNLLELPLRTAGAII